MELQTNSEKKLAIYKNKSNGFGQMLKLARSMA